ncbi:hypothetical protein ACA910_017085 [Epithemia clementina (nom. ined.)]
MAEAERRSSSSPRPNGGGATGSVAILPIHVALLRFLVLVAIGWVMLYSAMSANAKWTVETYLPWSFWLLHYLLIFGIIGGGWPFVAPLGLERFKGYWNGHFRLVLGFLMTGLTLGVAVALSAFFVNVWWGYPLFPAGAWFGIGLFWITLWWVLDIQTSASPLIPHHSFPPVNIVVSSLVCIFTAVAVFQFVDYKGPLANDSSNPHGSASGPWWFGCVVSIIVWVQNFGSILVFQNWPFTLLPHPWLQHAALTATTVLLGWAIYEIIIAAEVNYSFFADAVGSSQICWSLYHTMAFDFWPFHKMVQPIRGLFSFFFSQVVMSFFWVWICRIILQPIYDRMVETDPFYGVIFTVNTMIPWFSLHTVAPLLIIHHSFFMRWPLPPAGPPMGPRDVGMVQELEYDNITEDTGDETTMSREEKEQLVEVKGDESDIITVDKLENVPNDEALSSEREQNDLGSCVETSMHSALYSLLIYLHFCYLEQV